MLVDDGQWALTLSVPYNRATQCRPSPRVTLLYPTTTDVINRGNDRLRCGDNI